MYFFGEICYNEIENFMKGCFPYEESKKIASLVVASALLTSSFAAITSVNAAEVDSAQTASADSTLRDKVGDGVMLHAFNWSYNTIKENLPAIAAAGYTTVQTSPVQQPKDYSTSGDVTGQWWKLYQPISFHIAEESWLGTKDDLKSLCDEADKYGIKIICDIVSNHIANADEARPDTVSNQVKSTSLSSIRKEKPTPVRTKAMQTTVRFRQLFRVMFQSVLTL